MLMLQSITAVGVWTRTPHNGCQYNDQCESGAFCNADDPDIWAHRRCTYCGSMVPIPQQIDPVDGVVLNVVVDGSSDARRKMARARFNTSFVAEICATPTDQVVINLVSDGQGRDDHVFPASTVEAWCEACVHPIDGNVNTITMHAVYAASALAMTPTDWLTFIFATFVASLTVSGELRDIRLCSLAIERAGNRLGTPMRLALTLLGGIRRWLFLPALMMASPRLVLLRGGDALNVCMNTIAVLFLCEVDNVAYAVGLSEKVRARVEFAGRVHLDADDVTALSITKAVHVFFLVICVPLGVATQISGSPIAAFILAGLAEVVATPGVSTSAKLKRVGVTVAAFLLGQISFVILVLST